MNRSTTRPQRKRRYRLMHNFWLDMHKPEEERIADVIERLKSSRSFAKTVRDGIRLIWDLKQGRTDVLTELFPLIAARLAPAPALKALPDGRVQAQLARIEQMLAKQQNGFFLEERTTERTTENPLKKLQSITIDDEDEPDLIIRPATSDGNKATENFLSSLMALQG